MVVSYNLRERVSTPGGLGGVDEVVRSGRLASVFCRLHFDAFTGVVFAENDEHSGVFSFRAGEPVFVEMPDDTPMGDLLLDRGLLDRDQYTEITAAVTGAVETSDDVAFCDQAVALGCLSQEQVDMELSRRVRGRVIEAVAWEDCRMDIDASPDALTGIREYPQTLGPLLYMGVHTFYDETRVRQMLGDSDSLFVRLNRPVGRIADFLDLDAQERSLLERIDPGALFAPLVKASSLDALDAWQLVTILVIAGMAEIATHSFAPAAGVERSGVLDRPEREVSPSMGTGAHVPGAGRMFAAREEVVGRRTVDRMPVVDEGAIERARAAAHAPARPLTPPEETTRPGGASRPAQTAGTTPPVAPMDSNAAQGGAVARERVGSVSAPRPSPGAVPFVDDQMTRRLPRRPSGGRHPVAGSRTPAASAETPRSRPTSTSEGGAAASTPAESMERAATERVPAQAMDALAAGVGAPRAASRRPTTAVQRLGRELQRRRAPEPSPPPPPPVAQSPQEAHSHVKQLLARRRQGEQLAKSHEHVSVEELLRQAIELLRDQHFARALALVQQCCNIEPTAHVYRMYRLWAELRSAGASDDLRAETRQLLREFVDDERHKGFAHYALGFMALQDGKEETAERHFKKAVTIDKTNKDAERHLRILERRREAAQQAKKR